MFKSGTKRIMFASRKNISVRSTGDIETSSGFRLTVGEVLDRCGVRKIVESKVLPRKANLNEDVDAEKLIALFKVRWSSLASDPRAMDAILRCLVFLGKRRIALDFLNDTQFPGAEGWRQRLRILMPTAMDRSRESE